MKPTTIRRRRLPLRQATIRILEAPQLSGIAAAQCDTTSAPIVPCDSTSISSKEI